MLFIWNVNAEISLCQCKNCVNTITWEKDTAKSECQSKYCTDLIESEELFRNAHYSKWISNESHWIRLNSAQISLSLSESLFSSFVSWNNDDSQPVKNTVQYSKKIPYKRCVCHQINFIVQFNAVNACCYM